MSKESPTPEELSEIEQFQWGAYGAEPPEWWFDQKNAELSRPVIPAEAVEALARELVNGPLFKAGIEGYGWGAESDSSDHFMPAARTIANNYLEAAAPHIQAAVWAEAYSTGFGDAKGGNIYDAVGTNPYRSKP